MVRQQVAQGNSPEIGVVKEFDELVLEKTGSAKISQAGNSVESLHPKSDLLRISLEIATILLIAMPVPEREGISLVGPGLPWLFENRPCSGFQYRTATLKTNTRLWFAWKPRDDEAVMEKLPV